GMRRVRGPFSLSVNESCGLLVDGFDARPTMMMNYAPPYAGSRIEACGYAKAKDLIAYDYELATTPEIDPRNLLKRRTSSGRVVVRPMDMRRYRAELALILEIFNDAWSENWSALPFTDEEMVHTAS